MDLRTVIEVGGILIAVVSAFLFDKWQGIQLGKDIMELKEVNRNQWNKIDELREWDIKHERESHERRLEIKLEISKLDGIVGKLDGKLDSIEKKLDDLIKTMQKRNNS